MRHGWVALGVLTIGGGVCVGCNSATGTSATDAGPAHRQSNSSERLPAAAAETAVTEPTIATAGTGDATVRSKGADNHRRADQSAAFAAEIIDVTFDDLSCNMQQDVVFRPWMLTERAKELDGRRIRIAGYMLPDLKQRGIEEFVLLRNTECKFGPGGQADHLIRVKLLNGVTTAYQGSTPIEVEGTLQFNPYQGIDGNTWSIYDMAGESVKTRRR